MDFRLRSTCAADRDVESIFRWYERERSSINAVFLGELAAAYDQLATESLACRQFSSGIRRIFLRRLPYVVYFAVDGGEIVVLTVLRASKDPSDWQQRSDWAI